MIRQHPLRTADYLQHMAQAIDNIQSYTTGMDAANFKADRKTQDAVIRNLEIIGEACNNVVKNDAAFAQAHPGMPWGFAYEMRNALAHGYFKVDLDIVWATVIADLPGMKAQLAVLDSMCPNPTTQPIGEPGGAPPQPCPGNHLDLNN